MLIFLTGYMGSGKSSLGRKLASRLGYGFVDLDEKVEEAAGKSINDIFSENGELYFRMMERNALEECIVLENTVIATGGGAPCHGDNMQLILKHGTVVYIKMHPHSLASRLLQSPKKRPLLEGIDKHDVVTYIKNHLPEREKYYLKANLIIKGEDLDATQLYEKLKYLEDNKL